MSDEIEGEWAAYLQTTAFLSPHTINGQPQLTGDAIHCYNSLP